MKKAQKLLSIVFALGLVVSLVATAFADSIGGAVGDNLTWTLEEGELTIFGAGDMENFTGIDVPVEIFNAVPWYTQRESITSVVIENSITSIGNSAFDGCSSLTSVAIPNSVISIGHYSFAECSSLTSITIPDSVTSIGEFAFLNCSNLTSVTISTSVTSIGGFAFLNCSSLTDVYYDGSEAEWNEVVDDYNSDLKYANIHYNSDGTDPLTGFKDISSSDFFYEPLVWAIANNITVGTTANTFSPYGTCTRGQIITFLWRAAGSPEPSSLNSFSDVDSSDYYYSAIQWAYENGIDESTGTFKPDSPCTRGTVVEYLWKLAGSPKAASDAGFTDVSSSASYANAVAWAVEQGITTGTSSTTFSPSDTCTRGQIVTFLFRYATGNATTYKDAYKTILKTYSTYEYIYGNSYETVYYLYDLESDGAPELIVFSAGYNYELYTFNGTEAVKCGTFETMYSLPLYGYYGNGLVVWNGGNGYAHNEYFTLYTIENYNIVSTTLIELYEGGTEEELMSILSECTHIEEYCGVRDFSLLA